MRSRRQVIYGLIEERDRALEQRDRARALACRLEEELALIRRSLSKAHRL